MDGMVNLRVTESTLWGRKPNARQALVQELIERFGVVVTRKQVMHFLTSNGRDQTEVNWLFNNRLFRAARGQYTLQPLIADGETVSVPQGA